MYTPLSKDELPSVLPVKRGRSSKLRQALLQLEVGAGLFVPKEAYQTKHGPAAVVHRLKRTSGIRVEYGMKPDGSGWIFRRNA
jgi:hypothetical protein